MSAGDALANVPSLVARAHTLLRLTCTLYMPHLCSEKNVQFRAIVEYLKQHEEIEKLWIDVRNPLCSALLASLALRCHFQRYGLLQWLKSRAVFLHATGRHKISGREVGVQLHARQCELPVPRMQSPAPGRHNL